MLQTFSKVALMTLLGAGLLVARPGSAEAQELVDMLVSRTGATSEQATGGAGAIFNVAKERLSPSEFGQIADAVPGMETMLGASPPIETAAGGGTLGSLSGMAGGLGSLSSLAGAFDQLGMTPDMVQEFVPLVLDYVGSEGGSGTMQLLQGALF